MKTKSGLLIVAAVLLFNTLANLVIGQDDSGLKFNVFDAAAAPEVPVDSLNFQVFASPVLPALHNPPGDCPKPRVVQVFSRKACPPCERMKKDLDSMRDVVLFVDDDEQTWPAWVANVLQQQPDKGFPVWRWRSANGWKYHTGWDGTAKFRAIIQESDRVSVSGR